jgi:hypothetical protein
MSLWTDQKPPVLYPNAVATEAGWADPVTGELYVAVTGLSTFKGTTAELTNLGLYNNKSRYTTNQELGNSMVYGYNDYIVLEAVFSEPVTWSGGPPSIAGTINTTPVTFAYFQDTTDLLSDTVGKVMSITIGSAGSHYQVGDLLTFTGGGGTQVFPTDANLSGVYDDLPGTAKGYVSAVNGSGGITGIVLTNNGASYASAPTVGVSTGHVVSITVSGSGTGYLNGDTLVFSGGGGSGAAGYIVVNATGNVTEAVVTNPGSGYTSAPTVATATSHGSGNSFTVKASFGAATPASLTAVLGTVANGKGTNRILFRYQVASNLTATSSQITFTSPISGGTWTTVDSGSGTGAAASGVVSSGVTSYTMTNNGSGYTSAPLVTITSLTGTGATAVAVLDKGVNTVTPVIAGVGYRSAPSVSQSGGGSTNATITPVLGTAGIVCDVNIGGTADTTAVAGSVIVNNTGHGGTGFAATATVSGGGDVTGITITNVGSGYTSAPTLTLTGMTNRTLTAVLGFPIASYTVSGTNTGYTAAPSLTVGNPTANNVTTSLGAGVVVNTTATATATLKNNSTVASVQPVAEGSGYADATVVFNNTGTGGSNAAATAVYSGEISSFVVTNPGSGYYSAPTVSIGSGDGTGAAATATVDDRGHVVAVTTNGYVSGITVSGVATNFLYVDGEPLSIQGGATGHIHVVNTTTTNPANGFETITGQTVTAVVDNAGSGYTNVPTVTYPLPGRGAGLTFTASIAGVSSGSGYTATLPVAPATPIYTAAVVSFTPATETPTLTFNATQFVSGVTVSGTGQNYEANTALVFTGTAVGGNVASGNILTDETGNVIGAVIYNGGSYTTAPTVTIAAPPAWSSSYAGYAVGQIVSYSGTRYKALIGGATNFDEEPDTSPTFWASLSLYNNTLTAVMGSSIVGTCTVDGVVPTVSSTDITHDRFGDIITQTTFNTGDFFTVSFTCSKPVFVVNGSGATVPLVMTSGTVQATYFSGSGSETLRFAYQVASTDSSAPTTFSVTNTITLASGTTIEDAAGNPLTLTGWTAPTTSGVTVN